MSAVIVLVLVLVIVIGGVAAYALWPEDKKKDPEPKPSPTPPTPGGKPNNKPNNKPAGCAWDQYLAQDNDKIPHCKQLGCALEGTTVEQCKAACCAMPTCASVQWRDDGRCLLKDTVDAITPTSNDKTLYVKKAAV
jgi:hypothetical protein